MCNQNFLCGVGVGMVAGAAAAMAMMSNAMPGHKKVQRAADKAVRTIGEIVENFADSMSL